MNTAGWTGLAFALICCSPAATRADEAVPVRDERFSLNVAERRIERSPYDASLQVGVDRPSVRVGAAVSAARLIVLLRGVRGDVQFHGDLSRLSRIEASHPARAVSAKEIP